MSNKPEYLIQLIELASKAAGNDSQLAEKLEVNRQAVSNWRHGKKPCPAADQALMAGIAGLDAEAFAARALIAQHEGTEKGELLKQVLKKAFVATGAALGTFGASASETVYTVIDFIRCILCLCKSYEPCTCNRKFQ